MKKNSTKTADRKERRNFLKAGSAGLLAASVPSVASAALPRGQIKSGQPSERPQRNVAFSGVGWNRALPGLLGQACLTFDLRAEVGGTGLGTFRDDVYPELNSHFQINSVTNQAKQYTFEGEIIASRDPGMVGTLIRIEAEGADDGTARATITLARPGDLVTIAIIAVIIALLLPAIPSQR